MDLIQDTFCGQGLFTFAFRHRHPKLRVVSIDRSGPALQQLQLNLATHGVEDVDVVQGGAPAWGWLYGSFHSHAMRVPQ